MANLITKKHYDDLLKEAGNHIANHMKDVDHVMKRIKKSDYPFSTKHHLMNHIATYVAHTTAPHYQAMDVISNWRDSNIDKNSHTGLKDNQHEHRQMYKISKLAVNESKKSLDEWKFHYNNLLDSHGIK